VPVCLVVGYLLHFFTAGTARDFVARYAAAPVCSHPMPDIVSFFGPLELVPPGLVEARQWHPAHKPESIQPRSSQVIAGVARKP
jgi:S-adenosyl methyltransferase